MSIPHFLCIGAKRSGTSWLYENLKRHPQIWLPPYKEIHYFDHLSSRPLIMELSGSNRISRLVRKNVKRLLTTWHRPGEFRWYRQFLLPRRNHAWYANLFRPADRQITGDITPAYANLGEHTVQMIAELMPDVKIIYLLRNPLRRTWSDTLKHFSDRGHPGMANVESEKISRYLHQKKVHKHSNYLRNLSVWEKYFPQHRIFIGFFDSLSSNPAGFLRSILEFLEVDTAGDAIPRTVSQKHGSRGSQEIPLPCARYLAQRYYPELEILHRRFNNAHTAGWLADAERFLG